MGTDPSKIGSELDPQAVSDLSLCIQFLGFFERDFGRGVHHLFDDLLELEQLNLSGFLIIVDLNLSLMAILLSRSRQNGLFEGLDDHLPVDPLILSYLVDDIIEI